MNVNLRGRTQWGLLISSLLLVLATALLLSACSSAEEKWQAQYDLGVRYLEEGRYEDAVLAFTAAIEIDPKQAPAYSGRGKALVQVAKTAAGDITDPSQIPDEAREAYEKAIADFREAIGLDATDSDCYRGAAEAYLALGQEKEAEEILQEGHEATGDEALLTMAQEIQNTEELGQTSEENPEQAPTENPEENPEQAPTENPEETPEQAPEETPEQNQEQNPEQNPADNPEQTPEQPTEPEPEQEPEQQPSPEPEQPAAPDAGTVYTNFLNNGGWAQATDDYIVDEIRNGPTDVSSCLADIDGDGVQELLLEVTPTGYSGPGGYETFTALLDQDNGTPVVRQKAYYGGGTGGGDYLGIRYDTQEKKSVLVLDGSMRDGVSAGESYLIVYDAAMQNTLYDIHYEQYVDDDYMGYGNEVARIRSETDLYQEKDGMVCAYKLNGQYISEADYNAWIARFSDSPYELKPASVSQPVAP